MQMLRKLNTKNNFILNGLFVFKRGIDVSRTAPSQVGESRRVEKKGADSRRVGEILESTHTAIDRTELARRMGYDRVGEFVEGLAWASRGEKFVIIDMKGKEIGKTWYDDAQNFSEGMAAVKTGTKWIFIDKQGKDLKIGEFDEAYSFSQSFAGVRNGPHWKFIKADGSRLGEKSYSRVEDFEDGVAHGKRGETWYEIDTNGDETVATNEAVEE